MPGCATGADEPPRSSTACGNPVAGGFQRLFALLNRSRQRSGQLRSTALSVLLVDIGRDIPVATRRAVSFVWQAFSLSFYNVLQGSIVRISVASTVRILDGWTLPTAVGRRDRSTAIMESRIPNSALDLRRRLGWSRPEFRREQSRSPAAFREPKIGTDDH